MLESSVKRIAIKFVYNNSESTVLNVERQNEGLYDIKGEYRYSRGSGFPAHELLSRSGGAFADRIEELRQHLVVSCRSWYHYYCRYGVGMKNNSYESSWFIRIEGDDTTEHWEGVGCAPRGLDNVYEELVAFGMPSMRLGYSGSIEVACRCSETTPLDPWHIVSYDQALERLVEEMDKDEASDDSIMLLDEFVDDVGLFLEQNCADALDVGAFAKAWHVEEAMDSLNAINVGDANRRNMMLLFGALVRLGPSHSDVARLVRDGSFKRWCRRLHEIPREEKEERRRLEREKRLAIAGEIDNAVRKFASVKTPFTSHEVAKSCGVTPQQASARIRTFVQRGELTPLEGSLPRRYRAA